jgi:Cu+-exporting ATPase
MNKETMKITGMTCAACAQRVEKAVGKLGGVKSASVNFATEKLTVEYDAGAISGLNIKETIQKTGYGVAEEAQNSHVTIPIGGMTCAACAQRIEKGLSKLDGVVTAGVNFATEKATVTYDSQKVRLSALRQTVEKLGYKA